MKTDVGLLQRIESILGVDLQESLGIPDSVEANRLINEFVDTVKLHDNTNLEEWLVPQWVVLAAGLGTRIDPTGTINKNLDVWFGGYNTLQLARRYLPGCLPHIVVLHPSLMERVCMPGIDRIDPGLSDALLGPNAHIVVQPQPDGTGGALRAAVSLLERSQAEFVGIAFGDEPFLDAALFTQTLISHFIHGADVTLCGKVPETVVDKGGLFFDAEDRLQSTKEWYDMTTEEQQWMWKRLEEGCAYTNTGITLIRRKAALERLERMQPHGKKSEYHHVDLIRYCYEDGLKTHAHIYRGEITSGVNRWNNVFTGQERLEEQQRQQLAQRGVRVIPGSRIWLGEGRHSLKAQVSLGRCVQLEGDVFLGHNVSIGDYSTLKNVSLFHGCRVGISSALTCVTAHELHIEDSPIPPDVGTPVKGLQAKTSIEQCELDHVWVGAQVDLSDVKASYTLIPPGTMLSNAQLGVYQRPIDRHSWLSDTYMPGVAVDSTGLETLKREIFEDWLPATGCAESLHQACVTWVSRYLNGILSGGVWASEGITLQQAAGVACEICRLISGISNPLWDAVPGRQLKQSDELPAGLQDLLTRGSMRVVWLLGDKRQLPTELGYIAQLLQQAHRLTLAAKSVGVLWDVTLRDMDAYITRLAPGGWQLVDTGSNCLGVDLRQTSQEFWNLLVGADLIVVCGSNVDTMRPLQQNFPLLLLD